MNIMFEINSIILLLKEVFVSFLFLNISGEQEDVKGPICDIVIFNNIFPYVYGNVVSSLQQNMSLTVRIQSLLSLI
jgi:hypothetical protein